MLSKAAVVTFVLFGLALPVTAAQTSTVDSATRASLLQAREQLWRAWFADDRATLEQILPAETIGINAGEKDWTDLKGTLEASAKFVADGGRLLRLEFPKVEVRRHGDVYIVYSEYLFETDTKGEHSVQSGRANEIFLLRKGKWINPGWHMDSGK